MSIDKTKTKPEFSIYDEHVLSKGFQSWILKKQNRDIDQEIMNHLLKNDYDPFLNNFGSKMSDAYIHYHGVKILEEP